MVEIEKFLSSGGYASTTIDLYRRVLSKFCADVDTRSIDETDLHRWVKGNGWANATQYSALCAVRGFLRYMYGVNHPALAVRVKRLESPPQRVISVNQIGALLALHDTGIPKGRRDLAICCLLLDTGLRSAEVCGAEVKYLDMEQRRVSVRVKGGKFGAGVFSDYTRSVLERWLADRERLAGPGCKTIFCGIGGNTPGQCMTTGGLRAEMRRWGKRAGLPALSPHDFRRTFATMAIRSGAPTRVVQVAGRWSNIRMVEHYTRSIEAVDMDGYYPVQRVLDS